MTPTLLGISLASDMYPAMAANALFLAPLGGLGADVSALEEAYKEEAVRVEYVPCHLIILDQALHVNLRAAHFVGPYQKGNDRSLAGQFSHRLDEYREGLKAGDYKKVHAAQMELVDIVGATPQKLWKTIFDNVRSKRSWALEGGLFSTQQNPVTALRQVLGVQQFEEVKIVAEDFDQFSVEILERIRDRNRYMRTQALPGHDSILEGTSAAWSAAIFNKNHEGLPGSKMTLEKIREAKVAFLNGNLVDSFFALMEGSIMSGFAHESDGLRNLAAKFEIRVKESEQDYFFDRLKKHFDLIESRYMEQDLTLDRDLKALKAIRKIFTAMTGAPLKETMERLLKEVPRCSDYFRSLLRLAFIPLHLSFLEAAETPVFQELDALERLVEQIFGEPSKKKWARQRIDGIRVNIREGASRLARQSLLALKEKARQEGADNVVGHINDILEIV